MCTPRRNRTLINRLKADYSAIELPGRSEENWTLGCRPHQIIPPGQEKGWHTIQPRIDLLGGMPVNSSVHCPAGTVFTCPPFFEEIGQVKPFVDVPVDSSYRRPCQPRLQPSGDWSRHVSWGGLEPPLRLVDCRFTGGYVIQFCHQLVFVSLLESHYNTTSSRETFFQLKKTSKRQLQIYQSTRESLRDD